MSKNVKGPEPKALRLAMLLINGILFLINFLLFYFVWLVAFPTTEGFSRVIPCWVLAYLLTWILTYLTKGMTRLYVTLGFLALLTFVILTR